MGTSIVPPIERFFCVPGKVEVDVKFGHRFTLSFVSASELNG